VAVGADGADEPDDEFYQEGRQWGLDRIGVQGLWRGLSTGNAAVDVVVLDTGTGRAGAISPYSLKRYSKCRDIPVL
jgi:hypothetical protein